MSLYQRGRVWYYDFVVQGKRYAGSTRCRVKRDAEEFIVDLRRKIEENRRSGFTESWTLKTVMDRYSVEVLDRKFRDPVSARAQAKNISRIIGPDTPFEQVDTEAVQRYMRDRGLEGAADGTINIEVGRLSTAYSWLSQVYPKVARCVGVSFSGRPKRKTKKRHLSDAEVAAVLQELDPDRPVLDKFGRMVKPNRMYRQQYEDQRDLFVFLLETGARLREGLSLRWDAIRWNEGYIDLYRSKTDTVTKVALTENLKALLNRRLLLRRDYPVNIVHPSNPYVFPQNNGSDPMGHLGKSVPGIRKAIERAGLNAPHLVQRYGKATVHTLRHTFVTALAEDGTLDPFAIQRAAGHASLTTTLKYIHAAKDNVDAVRAAIERRRNDASGSSTGPGDDADGVCVGDGELRAAGGG